MSELGKIVSEIYRKQYEFTFKDHPNGSEIVEKLVAGGNSIEQIDLWFAEAESYSWQKIMNAPRPEPDENGYVTFKIYRGD